MRVLIPTPTLLANAMGDGTYFALFDSFQTKKRPRLSRFHGAFFEDYVASIFDARALTPASARLKLAGKTLTKRLQSRKRFADCRRIVGTLPEAAMAF